MQALPAAIRTGIVVAGYAAAFLFAMGVVWFYIEQTSSPDRDASSGMYAFGDFLLFVAVFGIVSIAPTGLALLFLRKSRIFWIGCVLVAFLVAGTSLAVVAATVLAPQSDSFWAMLAFPRIFLSPFLASAFALSAWIAPDARIRWCLLGAAAVEFAGCLYGFCHWFLPLFFR